MRGADGAHIRHRLSNQKATNAQKNDVGPYQHEKLKYSDSASYSILSFLCIYCFFITFVIFAADSNFPTPKNISNQVSKKDFHRPSLCLPINNKLIMRNWLIPFPKKSKFWFTFPIGPKIEVLCEARWNRL